MKPVFVDTSALYALLNSEDENHKRAWAIWDRLAEQKSELYTTNYVLVETTSLTQNRLGLSAVRMAAELLFPLLSTHWITEEEHATALQALMTAQRRSLSLVDCSSFVAMRTLGIHAAFHFDAHFSRQGFGIL